MIVMERSIPKPFLERPITFTFESYHEVCIIHELFTLDSTVTTNYHCCLFLTFILIELLRLSVFSVLLLFLFMGFLSLLFVPLLSIFSYPRTQSLNILREKTKLLIPFSDIVISFIVILDAIPLMVFGSSPFPFVTVRYLN